MRNIFFFALSIFFTGCMAVPYMTRLPDRQATAPTHPPTTEEVNAALQVLKSSGGCDEMKVTISEVQCEKTSRVRISDTTLPIVKQTSTGFNGFTVETKNTNGKIQEFKWYAIATDGTPQRTANQFADAWAVLAAYASGSSDEDTFKETVKKYLQARPKPELPEEARRFKVQAEDAVRRKEFTLAEERFNSALKIAPWWPEGRYNLALIYGELGLNDRAAAEMKRYLQLSPNAENYRQAQDKIYIWEGR